MPQFGALLRKSRLAAGLSQEALAEAAAVSLAAVSSYERGVRSSPHRTSVAMLADALGLKGAARDDFESAARRRPQARASVSGYSDREFQNNLLADITSFVGRTGEIDEIAKLLRSHRVVTVTGSGGIGKSRTAARVASRVLGDYPDGTWWIDIAGLREDARVASKITSVLGLQLTKSDEPETEIASLLRPRRMLLVLDNCEHLVDAVVKIIGAIMQLAPDISVLATSRHRLHLSAEAVYRLDPLPIAPLASSADQAATYPAIELFVTRAQVVARDFDLTDNRVAGVVAICEYLDGIPLAIELAAARLPIFGLSGLLERLKNRLPELSTTALDVPARQRTLFATIDWSYSLLQSDEATLLQRLSWFSGGFSLDAADFVCFNPGEMERDITTIVASLVDKSLMSVDLSHAIPRYFVLESTRQYAQSRLSERDREDLARRHAEWLALLADDDELNALGLSVTLDEWTDTVLPELENVYQALDWTSRAADGIVYFARIVGGLYTLWLRTGQLEEGRRLVDAALAKLDADEHPIVASRLHLARSVSLSFDRKVRAVERAIALREPFGPSRGLAECHLHLASGLMRMNDLARLQPAVDRVWSQMQAAGLGRHYPWILWLRSRIFLLEGRLTEARATLLAARADPVIDRHDSWYEIVHELASVEYKMGDVQRAAELTEEALDASRGLRALTYQLYALVQAACYRLLLGEVDRAAKFARDGISLARGRNATVVTNGIYLLAAVNALRGRSGIAARLKGYVDAWFDREDYNHMNIPPECREMLVKEIERHLPPDIVERYAREGQQMSEDVAVAQALL
jgi:predicted ATPase/DNA-binding XRE family transcriptional regulator